MTRRGKVAEMRTRRGQVAHAAGAAAEDAVARHYIRQGSSIAARRWRSPGGEIDLVARDGAEVIFIEVKKARTHTEAAERLDRRQMDRLCVAAAAYLGGETAGQLTPMRFDVALVDARGEIAILENAFAA
ncbi:MAG TPA: YraN family protein [Paracoccaceae bacterium]|nr:YraN family protein [Paracoccaceae bacterium]HMO72767.1 YraN family protein [Paracoccaceae bacterium]